ncbi:MAG TPA: DUF6298 domain-containing protein, partial [Thermoanaerobaculia bacterium]|nr:DUF6298 domain-containing protein [Thermoanaerobaculia bacterium]
GAYLAGSHHWDVLVDNAERPGGFDFTAYLDRLESWGHNLIRLWTHEAWTHEVRPLPYPRTGPGLARDGRLRYDLSRFDPEYFGRLRDRAEAAGRRGFRVIVMLWNGWSLHDKGEGNPWHHHPMNRANNVNGIDGDPDACGDGADVHTLRVPAITRLQEAYLEKVVDTVGDLDHVLWEISNESPGDSVAWQYHMIRYLRAYEAARGRSHPIGMTATFPGGTNRDLLSSPADWISPSRKGGWMTSPPPADPTGKVVLLDTDHLWGIGGDRRWVWKSFLRGHHILYMDPLDADPVREGARRAMGHARRFAERMDFAALVPEPRLASTGYCLAKRVPGEEEVLVYQPRSGWARSFSVDLTGIAGELTAEWFDPEAGATTRAERVTAGARRRLRAPFPGDSVLYLRR